MLEAVGVDVKYRRLYVCPSRGSRVVFDEYSRMTVLVLVMSRKEKDVEF